MSEIGELRVCTVLCLLRIGEFRQSILTVSVNRSLCRRANGAGLPAESYARHADARPCDVALSASPRLSLLSLFDSRQEGFG